MKKIAVLIPGIQGLYESLPLMIQQIASKDKVLIAVDTGRVQRLIRMRKVSSEVILLGAKDKGRPITVKRAYDEIRSCSGIPIITADGVDWSDLPRHVMLPGKSFRGTLKAIFGSL